MTNDPCQTLLFGPPPDYMRACGDPAIGYWRTERRCRKHLLEMEANTCGEAANVRWDMDPAEGPLFWLCLPIVLVYVVGKVALAWLKTKLPQAPAPVRRCQECGWVLAEQEISILCQRCEVEAWARFWPWVEEYSAKLFCCDVDLKECGDAQVIGKLPENTISTTYHYQCPVCGRIWLYIKEWRKDSGSTAADWYPQWTEAERATGSPPDLYDERTRTKVYR